MSYILDALRKADAERERDPARGIHAQPVAAAGPAGSRRGAWLGAATAVLVAGLSAYAFWPREAPAGRAEPPRTPAPAPLAAPPAPASPAVAVATAVQPAAPPMPVAPPPAPAPAPAPAAKAPTPAPVAAPAPAADRVLTVAELPGEVQNALPKLAITGGVHSDNAAQRMLIVGGQVVSEGAELAPGLVLEQIRANAAVLRFRGYRYSVSY